MAQCTVQCTWHNDNEQILDVEVLEATQNAKQKGRRISAHVHCGANRACVFVLKF